MMSKDNTLDRVHAADMLLKEKIKAARKQLGGSLKDRREQLGISDGMLGSHVGVTANTIRGVESGRFAMDIDLQFKIYNVLGIKSYFSVQRDDRENKKEDMAIEISVQLTRWLDEHPLISRNALCEQVGYDVSNLHKAIHGDQDIPHKYHQAFIEALKPYGFNYGNP